MAQEHLLSFYDRLCGTGEAVIKGYDGESPIELTGQEFCAQARAIAGFLQKQGIGPGDRVAIIAEKCPQTIEAFFAIWLLGGIAVPVCETLKIREQGYILRDSGAKFVLGAGVLRQRFEKKDFNPEKSNRDPDGAAFIIYTSGSTGNPKGVVLTHRNIFVNAVCGADFIRMTAQDSMLSILPYWHSFALTAEIFTMLHAGGKIFIPRSRATFLKDVNLFKPTIVLSIPRLAQMLKRGIEGAKGISARGMLGGNIKYMIGGGAPLDRHMQEFFMDAGVPMYQGYGLTESSPIISINSPHDFKVGTSGKIIPWLTPEMGGGYCFKDGELLVKGKCVMKGYWNMPAETAQTIKDNWLYTGDAGYIDKDGFLMLTGRRKSLICLEGGEKFYPEFVEEALKASPYIEQAMVIGEGKKRPSVLVNVNEEMAKALKKEEIDGMIDAEISRLLGDFEPYQVPAKHLVLPAFTMEEDLLTNTQKIRRHKVFEKYGSQIEGLLKQ